MVIGIDGWLDSFQVWCADDGCGTQNTVIDGKYSPHDHDHHPKGNNMNQLIVGGGNVRNKGYGREQNYAGYYTGNLGHQQRQLKVYPFVPSNEAWLNRIDLQNNARAIPRHPAPERQREINCKNIIKLEILGKGINKIVRLRGYGKKEQTEEQYGHQITDIDDEPPD
jgi:hypothetical protein